jgi:hypothetical protein
MYIKDPHEHQSRGVSATPTEKTSVTWLRKSSQHRKKLKRMFDGVGWWHTRKDVCVCVRMRETLKLKLCECVSAAEKKLFSM